MFRAVLAASFVLAALGVAASGLGQPEAPFVPARIAAPALELAQLLGFAEARLVRVDPETLRPLPGKGSLSGRADARPDPAAPHAGAIRRGPSLLMGHSFSSRGTTWPHCSSWM